MKEIKDVLNKNIKYFKNSNDYYNIQMIIEDFKTTKSSIFVVLPNLYLAQKYYDYLNLSIKEDNILFYPVDEMLTTLMSLGSLEFQSERLYTLKRLLTDEKVIVVTTLDGAKIRQLKPKDYINASLKLEANKTYEIKDITNYLTNSGYINSYIVEKPGTFSVKGGIIDIYLKEDSNPYRLDFFDNYLETIKKFDPETQRSFSEVKSINITPSYELFYTDEMKDKAIKKIREEIDFNKLSKEELSKISLDIENIETRSKLQTLNIYIPFFNEEKTTLLDFKDNKKIYLIDEHKMLINEEQKLDDIKSYNQSLNGNQISSIPYYVNYLNIINKANINIDNLGIKYKDAYSLDVYDIKDYNNNLDLLYYDLINTYKDYEVSFLINDELLLKELKDFLLEKEFTNYKISNKYLGSLELRNKKEVYIDDYKIFNKYKDVKASYRSVLSQTTKIKHHDELLVGDYVVHYDFGIGKYMGLKTMTLSNIKKDYLQIIYKGNEKLYVPIEQINLILKYSSKEGHVPELSKMGSKKWQNTKLSVKKKIVELKDRLIKLYAKREEAKGFQFEKDTKLQQSFENDFKHELTIDQKQAIKRTKELMEKPLPMDLVLIGDVGFGKTEVALRAAFKAVLSGKQVLYLVPTTILARQHYLTFKERFSKYGGIVRLMNRFVSRKDQTKTIKDLEKGFVDVVIGTHRLLSNDIKFKDLGLLIIDEEQRFGVMHKERIKEMKVNVDTLTLSATPIPRTLQMTMMGIKDLETINTPPKNRYPIQTYVVPRNEGLIKESIRRELARGGQVFYLYNKVKDIEKLSLEIKSLVPEAKVAFAHGQMTKTKLENTIKDFIDHKYDCLIATTIIETGLDIPNTNTLLVHDADKLGLSQLYQIRGRVGRSDKIAYAYLMYEKHKDINDDAYKRLKALEEFTDLGSGYKIAMKDLSIRGAGDVLGSEQSGFIDTVGFDMYMQLLDEVINNKEELKATDNQTTYSNQTINEDYILKDSIRLLVHRKINKVENIKDLKDLKDELTDRFGKIDDDITNYMYEKLYNKLSNKIGVYKTNRFKDGFEIIINKKSSKLIDGSKLFSFVNSYSYKIKLGYINEEISINVNLGKHTLNWLKIACNFLEDYINNLNLT